jgi:hypothetical protein
MEQRELDHENLDKLDNRRSNLRPCAHHQNMHNIPKYANSSSQYIGVYWHKGARKWVAHAKVNRVYHYLGRYSNEVDAAKARDSHLRQIPELEGFFRPNFLPTE